MYCLKGEDLYKLIILYISQYCIQISHVSKILIHLPNFFSNYCNDEKIDHGTKLSRYLKSI